jgi:hypothetical protein
VEEKNVMRITHSVAATVAVAISLVTLCSPAAAREQFQTTPTTFSGQATAIKGTVFGVPIVLVDTGPVNAGGGSLDAHLLCYPDADCTIGAPDVTNGMLRASILNATVVAQGNHSRARASVAELAVNAGGHQISATFIEANAHAQCADGHAFVRGDAAIAELVVDGEMIAITADINQRVPLPGGLGSIIINEQVGGASSGDGDLTVRALHIMIPGPVAGTDTDLIVAEAHADIHCGQRFCPADKDFVTGGGWLPDPRRTFSVAGGIRHGAPWGHLLYINHATGVRAKGTGVTGYSVTGATTRHIEGEADIDGVAGWYQVDIDDRGEPGRRVDFVRITLSTGETAVGLLGGGNIQLHTCK